MFHRMFCIRRRLAMFSSSIYTLWKPREWHLVDTVYVCEFVGFAPAERKSKKSRREMCALRRQNSDFLERLTAAADNTIDQTNQPTEVTRQREPKKTKCKNKNRFYSLFRTYFSRIERVLKFTKFTKFTLRKQRTQKIHNFCCCCCCRA